MSVNHTIGFSSKTNVAFLAAFKQKSVPSNSVVSKQTENETLHLVGGYDYFVYGARLLTNDSLRSHSTTS